MMASALGGALGSQGMSGNLLSSIKQASPNMGGIFGSIMGQLNYNSPMEAASPYLENIAGTITPYYQPYINAGQNALSSLMGQYGSLINDPSAKMNQMGSQYQASPGYQYNVDQTTKAMNQAAAAGGMVGSPQEQQQLGQVVSGLANQDYYNYLNQAMGLYNTGLSGMGNINQMGYQASSGLAENLANSLMSQAGLAYAGTTAENQNTGGFWGGIGGMLGF
jgi:hypothetical protein